MKSYNSPKDLQSNDTNYLMRLIFFRKTLFDRAICAKGQHEK